MGAIVRSYGIVLLMLLAMPTARCLGGQMRETPKGDRCDPKDHRLSLLDAEMSHATPLSQRTSVLRSLDKMRDDPADCIIRTAQSKLVDVERQLIRLDVPDKLIPPDWLYQCETIAPKTQRCLGGSPYEEEIPHNTNEEIRTGHLLPLSDRTATVVITPGVACRVQTLSVLEPGSPHDGYPARIIPSRGGTFSLAPLRRMKSPVLLASIRCDDNLHFRKAAWLLLPK